MSSSTSSPATLLDDPIMITQAKVFAAADEIKRNNSASAAASSAMDDVPVAAPSSSSSSASSSCASDPQEVQNLISAAASNNAVSRTMDGDYLVFRGLPRKDVDEECLFLLVRYSKAKYSDVGSAKFIPTEYCRRYLDLRGIMQPVYRHLAGELGSDEISAKTAASLWKLASNCFIRYRIDLSPSRVITVATDSENFSSKLLTSFSDSERRKCTTIRLVRISKSNSVKFVTEEAYKGRIKLDAPWRFKVYELNDEQKREQECEQKREQDLEQKRDKRLPSYPEKRYYRIANLEDIFQIESSENTYARHFFDLFLTESYLEFPCETYKEYSGELIQYTETVYLRDFVDGKACLVIDTSPIAIKTHHSEEEKK